MLHTNTHTITTRHRIAKEAILLVPLFYILFVFINLIVETKLAIYDTVPVELRPDTARRGVSDFFETFPGDILPASILILIILFIMCLRWRKMWKSK